MACSPVRRGANDMARRDVPSSPARKLRQPLRDNQGIVETDLALERAIAQRRIFHAANEDVLVEEAKAVDVGPADHMLERRQITCEAAKVDSVEVAFVETLKNLLGKHVLHRRGQHDLLLL